jgi:hypothetical protein
MTDLTHRFIETNGIRMHVAEKDNGPLVVLCHGHPETWYSWRYQINDLATESGTTGVLRWRGTRPCCGRIAFVPSLGSACHTGRVVRYFIQPKCGRPRI